MPDSLQALQSLGARKLILVDSIKPFVGAFIAFLMLGEEMGSLAAVAIVITMAGVLLVALERSTDNLSAYADLELDQLPPAIKPKCPRCSTMLEHHAEYCSGCGRRREWEAGSSAASSNDASSNAGTLPHPPKPMSPIIRQMSTLLPSAGDVEGYGYATVNIVVDVLGAVITKQYGLGLQAWEINLVRFGSAAVMLDLALCAVAAAYWYLTPPPCVIKMEEGGGMQDIATPKRAIATRQARTISSQIPLWVQLPPLDCVEWCYVALGAMLCTFLTPVLSTTALFKIDVSTVMTLTSIGPILSLPLAYLIKGERITCQSTAGAGLTCLGVGLLAASL